MSNRCCAPEIDTPYVDYNLKSILKAKKTGQKVYRGVTPYKRKGGKQAWQGVPSACDVDPTKLSQPPGGSETSQVK